MNKEKKQSYISEMTTHFDKSEAVIVAHYQGLTVNQLDKLHDIASHGNDWLVNFQSQEREKTDIPSLKIGYNKVFGYYIEVTKTHSDKVPKNYIRKQLT